MERTLEQVLRDNCKPGMLVGSEFLVRVLDDHADHLDVSITAENHHTDTVDMAISGNEVTVYEE